MKNQDKAIRLDNRYNLPIWFSGIIISGLFILLLINEYYLLSALVLILFYFLLIRITRYTCFYRDRFSVVFPLSFLDKKRKKTHLYSDLKQVCFRLNLGVREQQYQIQFLFIDRTELVVDIFLLKSHATRDIVKLLHENNVNIEIKDTDHYLKDLSEYENYLKNT